MAKIEITQEQSDMLITVFLRRDGGVSVHRSFQTRWGEFYEETPESGINGFIEPID